MNKNIKLLLFSFAYVALPSIVLSLGIGYFTGNFLETFLITFGIIFLLGLISNMVVSNKMFKFVSNLERQRIDISNQQNVEVSCSACKARNVVSVKLAKRNVFPCSQCKKPNLIIFQFATAIVTEPIKLDQIGANTNA